MEAYGVFCTCFAAGGGVFFPSLVLILLGSFFLCPHHLPPSLFPRSPPTADIWTPTMFALQEKEVSVPSVSSSSFRLHFPPVIPKQNSEKSKLPLNAFLSQVCAKSQI